MATIKPKNRLSKFKVLFIGAGIIAGVITIITARIIFAHIATPSCEHLVAEAVNKARQQVALPVKIDKMTTLMNISETAGNQNISYQYIVSGINPNQLSAEQLKQAIAPKLCEQSNIQELFDKGVAFEYHYVFKNLSNKIDFTVTKIDC